MKMNSPLLQEIVSDQDFTDSGWSWWEVWGEHAEVIEEYFGIRNFYASEDDRFLIDKKETYIEVKKGKAILMISGDIESTYKHRGATKNIGKVITNKCFKKELDWHWDLHEWTSDGKTTEMTFGVGKDYSASYGDNENWIARVDAVGKAMELLSRFEKVKGRRTKEQQETADRESQNYLSKLKEMINTDDPANINQAISLAESLGVMGELKSAVVSQAYATIKKMGINLTKIEGL
jgi:hypothetical protein